MSDMTCVQHGTRGIECGPECKRLTKAWNEQTCEWFALCDHPATGTMSHPVLGEVPICDRCRERVEKLA